MAFRKASEEPRAVALGSSDFWAAVQNGGDVQISVTDILTYLRTVLQISDMAELRGALDLVGVTAHDELTAALGTLDGSVSDKLAGLRTDVNTTIANLGSASRKDTGTAVGQIPLLGTGGKLDASTIPAVAITDVFPVASQAAMLALTAERGDIAIRSDLNRSFVLKNDVPGTLANWAELLTPTDAVLAVAGLTGSITAGALKTALGIAIGDVAGLQTKLNALDTEDAAIRTAFAAGDTSVRQAFAAADTQIRTDFAAADALKASLDASVSFAGVSSSYFTARAGGVNGGVLKLMKGTGANTLNGDGVLIDQAGNLVRIYEAGSPYRGVNLDLTGCGSQSSLWHTGNFDPATKATLNAAASFSTLTVSGAASFGAISGTTFNNRTSAAGGITLVQGGAGNTGYLEFNPAGSGTRLGYLGYAPAAGGAIPFQADGTNYFNFTGTEPKILGNQVWHAGTFNPGTKANLAGAAFTGAISGTTASFSGAGQFGSLNVTARPTWAGVTPWDSGNFNPATKLDIAGGLVTGQLIAKASVGGAIASRAGDGSFLQVRSDDGGAAAMTFHRGGAFATWFGLDTDNEFKRGGWSDGAVSYKFWTEKNFNPGTKADLTGANFTGYVSATQFAAPIITATGGSAGFNVSSRDGTQSAVLYSQADTFRVFQNRDVFRVHNDGNLWTPYFGYLSDQFAAKVSNGASPTLGSLTLNGTLTVGSGQPSSTISMVDTDEGTRHVHNNSGTIGFLGSDGGWKFRVYDSGAVWTAQLGDLNGRIEDRAYAWASSQADTRLPKTGGEMTGDLSITKVYPNITFTYPNVGNWQIQVRENNRLYFYNAQTNSYCFSIGGGGDINTAQLGDLNTRIENRINNKSARLAYAGDLDASNVNFIGTYWEPYGGGVITGMGSQQYGLYFFNKSRFRYLQMSNSNGDWYTCGYV